MEPFLKTPRIAAPLVRANVDTDAIIPSREMKTVGKTGLADGLFAGWRYTQIGGREPNPAFVLNQPDYAGATVLLGGVNFGCGSSREHAAWALAEYGFRVVIAPSFNPIFYTNCVRNGIVPLKLALETIEALAADVAAAPQTRQMLVDLAAQTVTAPNGDTHHFDIDAEAKDMLLEGLDAIDLTLKNRDTISAFVANDKAKRPWIYL
jgi:3-isopropylmalate/(R)-2-methylmalate dehydratase small subunit